MLTLRALNRYIRQALALNFPAPLWVTAEIAKIQYSRGHCYLELIEKKTNRDENLPEEDEIAAQASAVIWKNQLATLRPKLGDQISDLLREGVELKLFVLVDYHERYGLKLIVQDLDADYTLGRMELTRRQTLLALKTEGLIERNKQVALPLAIQRIAVVSSPNAAGLQDFEQHLRHNPYGYAFSLKLHPVAVQGRDAALQTREALERIAQASGQYDVAIVLRGGGSRTDLAPFDDLRLCRTAANMPLPLLSGIGHDIDQSALDVVAHTALKTPTAAADFIIWHNAEFEGEILNMGADLKRLASARVEALLQKVAYQSESLRWSARSAIQRSRHRLSQIALLVPERARHALQRSARKLDYAEALCAQLHPSRTLRRGYSLTFDGGRLLRSAAETSPGASIETRLSDGSILRSEVQTNKSAR